MRDGKALERHSDPNPHLRPSNKAPLEALPRGSRGRGSTSTRHGAGFVTTASSRPHTHLRGGVPLASSHTRRDPNGEAGSPSRGRAPPSCHVRVPSVPPPCLPPGKTVWGKPGLPLGEAAQFTGDRGKPAPRGHQAAKPTRQLPRPGASGLLRHQGGGGARLLGDPVTQQVRPLSSESCREGRGREAGPGSAQSSQGADPGPERSCQNTSSAQPLSTAAASPGTGGQEECEWPLQGL